MKSVAELAYVKGDATTPIGAGSKIIVHICNDLGKWGKGFVVALSKRWKAPEREYRAWFTERSRPALGDVQFVTVEPGIVVANTIGQHGIGSNPSGMPPIRYEALELALQKVALFARESGASVHMPRIGCGLAGGSWERIEPILHATLVKQGISVVVYDL